MAFEFLRRIARSRPPGAAIRDGAVVFVCDTAEPLRVEANHVLAPLQASLRLRVLIPARTLARHAPVWCIPPRAFLDLARSGGLGRPHCVVIGKIATASLKADRGTFEALLGWTPRARMPLFADFCDDYSDVTGRTGSTFFAAYQEGLVANCRLIASCEALRAALAPSARGPVEVIEDPYESPAARPVHEIGAADLRLCWFGNLAPATLPPLEKALRAVLLHFTDRAIRLELVAGSNQHGIVGAMANNLLALHRNFRLEFNAWSTESAAAAIERAEFVLLPQDAGSRWGQVKSHNRLVESLRGGRLAVASPIPSYVELQDYACVGDDPVASIEWALAHPAEAAQRVRRGQAYVAERFSPERIGERWRQVLGMP